MGPGRPIRDAVLRLLWVFRVGLRGAAMDRGSSGKGKVAAKIVATVVAVLIWGFGVEYVLHSYVFVSPPESHLQNIR
jgi:hypothetical protein